ncbi:putative Myb/SANT-like domain-containing protein [Helianthus annuus]|nr:putative Myb/SANT-like domain-containing protein [Helianthus annuus]
MIFVELCLEEVNNGNRPASHFNKVGWTNLGNNLKTRTGKDYLAPKSYGVTIELEFVVIGFLILFV